MQHADLMGIEHRSESTPLRTVPVRASELIAQEAFQEANAQAKK